MALEAFLGETLHGLFNQERFYGGLLTCARIYLVVVHAILLVAGLRFIKYTRRKRFSSKEANQPSNSSLESLENEDVFAENVTECDSSTECCQHNSDRVLDRLLLNFWVESLRSKFQQHSPPLQIEVISTNNNDDATKADKENKSSVGSKDFPVDFAFSCSNIHPQRIFDMLGIPSDYDAKQTLFNVNLTAVDFEVFSNLNDDRSYECKDLTAHLKIKPSVLYKVMHSSKVDGSQFQVPASKKTLEEFLDDAMHRSFQLKIGGLMDKSYHDGGIGELSTTDQSNDVMTAIKRARKQSKTFTRNRKRAVSVQHLSGRLTPLTGISNGSKDDSSQLKKTKNSTRTRSERPCSTDVIGSKDSAEQLSKEMLKFGWKVHESSALLIEAEKDGETIYYHIPPRLAKQGGYNIKGKKIHVYLGHFFVATHFISNSMPCCKVCSLPLPKKMGKQGYICRACGMITHKRCHYMTNERCPKSRREGLNLQFLGSTDV